MQGCPRRPRLFSAKLRSAAEECPCTANRSSTTASRCRPRKPPRPSRRAREVLLRVSHCGVCHSDIHLQDGYFDLGGGQKLDVRGNRPLPFTLGHEIAGTVEAAGPEATGRRRRASSTPPIPGSAAASAGCARAATSTCATRRERSASPSTAAMPRTCWCRIRAICSTWRASRRDRRRADVLRPHRLWRHQEGACPTCAPARC